MLAKYQPYIYVSITKNILLKELHENDSSTINSMALSRTTSNEYDDRFRYLCVHGNHQ